MPYPSSSNLILWPAEGLGGALQIHSMPPWPHNQSMDKVIFKNTPPDMFFASQVDVTADPFIDSARSAIYRLACYYLISRISERSIGEACEALYEIYMWQTMKDTTLPALPERRQVMQFPQIRNVPEQHFIFDVD